MTEPRPPSRAGPSGGSEGSPTGGLPDLQALLAGAPDAVDRWYRREHPDAFRLCLGLLADASDADDAAQDAMLLLLDRLDR